jgi:hypothetical protein
MARRPYSSQMQPTFVNHEVPPVESRTVARKRALLGAKVVSRDGIYSCDCSIRDRSVSGARINISNSVTIASPFFLIDHTSQVMFEAKIVWRSVSQAGVKFLDQHPLNNVEKLKLRFSKGT